MTNEELIAQARELCERKIAWWQEVFDWVSEYGDGWGQRDEINSWTTHLAEMDEHQGVHTDYGYVCQKCSKSFSQNGMTIRQYPCDFIVTKAKRLLGVE